MPEPTSTTARETGKAAAKVRAPQTATERRVAELRELATTDPGAARDRAWSWFEELKERSGSDAAAAAAELNELFRYGTPARGLDGPTDGILVMTTTNPLLDPAVRALTGWWMPWQGKRFDRAAATGDNRMTKSSSLPAKLLWPLHAMKEAEGGKLAFDFKTYVERGKDDPDRDVMVIDYANVEGNPTLLIKQIRDELVEVVAGAYLGKILFKPPVGDGYKVIGFFALRAPR
jgi:hypothetical protein